MLVGLQGKNIPIYTTLFLAEGIIAAITSLIRGSRDAINDEEAKKGANKKRL